MKKNKHHIYWFAPYNLTCPSTRYRGKYPLEYMNENFGISFDFIYPDKSIGKILSFIKMWMEVLLFRKAHSIVVIQKICTDRFYANMLKFLIWMNNSKTFYDLDDAEYYRNNPKTLNFFISNCAFIQVGSQALYDYCKKMNANVYIATSPVVDHTQRKEERGTKPNIGWVGDFGNGNRRTASYSHKTNLYRLVFPEVAKISYPVKLSIIGVKKEEDIPEIEAYFLDHPFVELDIPRNLTWEKDGWVYTKIKEFDMGLAPLVAHPFNEAKSAFKAKQYLSCGVPVLASDVGENEKFVKNGHNGFLFSESNELPQLVDQIVQMKDEKYVEFSVNCLKSKELFSMENYCQILIEKLTE